jgi:hypothetical protein
MMKKIIYTVSFLLCSVHLFAQAVKFDKNNLESNQVSVSIEKLNGKKVVKVIKDSTVKAVDEPTFAKLKDIDFKDGTIEVKVLSRLLKTAPAFARGFIGVAFRINDRNSKFEAIYLRPTNGRTDDQIRRNHSIQYFAYPDFKFDRLREETPEMFETYADIGLNEWIKMRIEVKNKTAKLYINNQKHPSFIVSEMLGNSKSGSIGLWVDIGTEGYFRDLKVIKQ